MGMRVYVLPAKPKASSTQGTKAESTLTNASSESPSQVKRIVERQRVWFWDFPSSLLLPCPFPGPGIQFNLKIYFVGKGEHIKADLFLSGLGTSPDSDLGAVLWPRLPEASHTGIDDHSVPPGPQEL